MFDSFSNHPPCRISACFCGVRTAHTRKTSIQLATIKTHKDKTNNKTSNRQIEISLCCHRRGRRKERHGESTRWGHFRQGHTCHCCRIEEKQNGRFHFFSFCKYYVCLIPTQFQESTGNLLLVFPYFWAGQSLLRLLTSRIALKGKKSIMIWRLRDLDNFSAYIVIRADSVFQLYIYVYMYIYVIKLSSWSL